MIMMRHSVNNNTRIGLVIFLCSNSNHLISLTPPPPLPELPFTQLWYYSPFANAPPINIATLSMFIHLYDLVRSSV